jgi:flavin-dependent dehydrogenase
VRREAGLDSAQMLSARFGFSRHYRLAPWSDMVEVYWGKRCQLYVTPVGPEEIGVALLTRDPGLRLDTALGEVPALQRRLGSAAASCMEHGASTTTRRLHRVFQQQTVLIGDASGSVDAISGEGLSLSFLQALSLAEALEAGDLRIYQREHRRLARRPGMMAGLLLMLEKMPRLRHGVWRALAFEPSIFGRLLNTYAVRPVSG